MERGVDILVCLSRENVVVFLKFVYLLPFVAFGTRWCRLFVADRCCSINRLSSLSSAVASASLGMKTSKVEWKAVIERRLLVEQPSGASAETVFLK
jgi:hypothetical protein